MSLLMAVLIGLSILSDDSLNINTVSARLLGTVPGIGSVKAEAIEEYRDTYGPFYELGELEYVPGIGPGTVDLLRESCFIDPEALPLPDTSHWLARADSLDPLVEVFFLDVGQGDAILVRASEGRTLLFDGGPGPNGPLEPAVVFRLRQLGVDTVHVLAFSHPHADHIGGLASVLETFTVLEVLDPGMVFSSRVYEDLLNEVMRAGCDYGLLEQDMVMELSPCVTATVEYAAPLGSDLEVNENSALMRITCGDFSVLLTGDIEDGTEMLLAPAAVPVTVLKVPHHGSLSSVFPPYLRSLSPQLAVFSCGRRNRFGHPHPRVVETYEEMGCGILRTDTQGTIVVQSDGKVFSVSTLPARYRPEERIED